MNESTRSSKEWAVRFADGLVEECNDEASAVKETAYAAGRFAEGVEEYEGAEVVVRTVFTTVTDWRAPSE